MHERARRHLVAELAEGGRRAAHTTTCPRCAAPTITGDDHDEVALIARVDAEPIDLTGEMLAHLDGRYTCSLERQTGKTARPGAHCLWTRYREQIHAARIPNGTLHREHRCPDRKAAP